MSEHQKVSALRKGITTNDQELKSASKGCDCQ